MNIFFTCWISDNSPWSSKVLDKCETPEKDKNENHMSQNGSREQAPARNLLDKTTLPGSGAF